MAKNTNTKAIYRMFIKKLESWEKIYATSRKKVFVYDSIYRIKSEVAFFLSKHRNKNQKVGEKKWRVKKRSKEKKMDRQRKRERETLK